MAEEEAGTAAQPGSGRMRIVHVLHFFGAGGLEKGVETLIRRGSGEFEHAVVVLEELGDIERQLPRGTPLLALDKPPGNSLRFLRKLVRVLKGMKPCVVHTRNWAGIDAIIAARLAGIRTVIHGEHGWGMEDPLGRSPRRRRVRRFLSRFITTMTCVSEDIRGWLERDVRVRCPVVQIYNGVDTDVFVPGDTGADVRREIGCPPDAPLVGCVGRLDPIKDHDTLFRAFDDLRRRFPAAQLLCVGDGLERPRLERLAGPGVHLLGTRTDVVRLLQAMDVFVLASHNEGISNTILEAMATGLPVVASRVGGNPELVVHGETGRLFPAGDPLALAAALAEYLEDPARGAAHGSAGRQRCLEKFSVEAMVNSYEAVWRASRRERTRP